jgi:methyl-accepting chemotaxis protein
MDAQHLNTILIVMVGIFGASVLLQLVVMGGAAIAMSKALKAARQYSEDMRAKLDPVLHSSYELLEQSRALMAKLEPKLEAAACDMADITRAAREETERLSASADEISGRIRRQAERVDEMATSALNSVDKVGNFLNDAVGTPARRLSGVVAAARAVINTLRAPVPQHTHPDEEERVRAERQQFV